MLEKRAKEIEHFNSGNDLPIYFTRSWMGTRSTTNPEVFAMADNWKGSVYQAFANGLRRFVTRTIINARPGLEQFEAMCVVEEMVRGEEVKEVGAALLDVGLCKEEAWSRAVRLLEGIFFSKKCETRIII